MRFIRIFCIWKLFVIGLMLANLEVGLAAEYYVSPNGNDNNSGSANSPWKTIEYAFKQLNPGDTLYIQDGTYEVKETIEIDKGSKSEPIVVKANGKNVVIKNCVNSPDSDNVLFYFKSGAKNWRFKGYEDNGKWYYLTIDQNKKMRKAKRNEREVEYDLNGDNKKDDVVEVYAGARCIYLKNGENITFSHVKVHNGCYHLFDLVCGNSINIENSKIGNTKGEIKRNLDEGPVYIEDAHGIVLEDAENCKFTGNEIWDCSGDTIQIEKGEAKNIFIYDNILRNTLKPGENENGIDIKKCEGPIIVKKNTIYGFSGSPGRGSAFAIVVHYEAKNVVISENTIEGKEGIGVYAAGKGEKRGIPTNIHILRNKMYKIEAPKEAHKRPTGNGFRIDGVKDITIKNNVAYIKQSNKIYEFKPKPEKNWFRKRQAGITFEEDVITNVTVKDNTFYSGPEKNVGGIYEWENKKDRKKKVIEGSIIQENNLIVRNGDVYVVKYNQQDDKNEFTEHKYLPSTIAPIKELSPPVTGNGAWKIYITKYGNSNCLLYNYGGEGNSSNYVPELSEWASYIRYSVGDSNEEKGEWLYNFPNAQWETCSSNEIKSKIWNDDLTIEITSAINAWNTREKRFYLRQDYKVTAKKNIKDLKFYQYMDADIASKNNNAIEFINDEGYSAYGIAPQDMPQITDARVQQVWIFGKNRGARGYGLSCVGWPQPDLWYIEEAEGWLKRNFPQGYIYTPPQNIDGKYGFEIGRWMDVWDIVEDDNLVGQNKVWKKEGYDSDVAVALRWSRRDKDNDYGNNKIELEKINLNPGDKITFSPGLTVVPEPCTMLLMGTGLAGLAGIARRRRRRS